MTLCEPPLLGSASGVYLYSIQRRRRSCARNEDLLAAAAARSKKRRIVPQYLLIKEFVTNFVGQSRLFNYNWAACVNLGNYYFIFMLL